MKEIFLYFFVAFAGKAKHLGVFSTEQEASEAYFRSVRELEETV